MSIQSKLTRIKQASKHEINAQEELNEYFNQDKVKQLLLDAKDLKDKYIIESNSDYQVVLIRGRIELYTSELELIYMRDIRLIEGLGKQNHRFVRTWSTEPTLTVSLDEDIAKVECHKSINDAEELIEFVDALLFGE